MAKAVSAVSAAWEVKSGQLVADQLAWWKLTKGQHLAAASAAGTSLVANLKHISVTLATWDAVWEVFLDPNWAWQRLQLYGAQDRALVQFFKKSHQACGLEAPSRAGGTALAAPSLEPAA
ncbi:hypothetical protein HaLaN_02542 [Haematococcus lacustris]|uniref:Uncharacterized protein n=1 Tax=Haematococcus lacustris TaxID=44745 RepID=A0A699YEC4_HAELA|nr:hypothetical protein HaLaN_02542 [Haematococcus lacustris]